MRFLVACLMALVLVGAAPVDHSKTIVATAEGGFRMGSPTAKVRLVEYASLTCPHCRAFYSEGAGPLVSKYVMTGQVSYEVRSLVLNGPDLAASTLARCQGPKSFFRTMDIMYSKQAEWTAPFATISQAESTRIAALPDDQQLAAVAVAGKLDSFAAANGMARAMFDQCLANKTLSAQLDALLKRAGTDGVSGTPTFFINGKKIAVNSWGGVEPLLRAAIARK